MMNLQNNTVLITGGATGIGFELATRLLEKNNTVIIVGRREEKLREAKALFPKLITYVCDVSDDKERTALVERVVQDYPDLNVLINNAGIMQYLNYNENNSWKYVEKEITTNLSAPIHLTQLFIPYFLQRDDAMMINVTSGLANVPLAATPVYCATKAALQSFTQSMRHQLNGKIRIIEVSPPHTNTDLGIPGTNTSGMPVDFFADIVIEGLAKGEDEINYGFSTLTAKANQEERREMFKQLNGNH